MNAVMKYMEFVARTKEYGKKVQQAKILKEEKTLLRERMKQNAIKGVGAKNKIVNDIIKNSPRQMTKFETKVNMMVYEEGEKASEELRKAEQAMEERKRYVKELNRKKKSLLNQMEKEQEEKKRKEKEEDDRNYMLYQQELREKLRIFLADKLREDKTYKSQMLNEHLFYAKLGKVKALSELKKQWLEEFQKTLEKQEFDKKLEEIKLKEKQVIHKEFIEKMMRDKEYKRELYLAEKLLEVLNEVQQKQHEGRVVERQKDMQFKESLLQKEQEQLEEELEFLYKCSKAKQLSILIIHCDRHISHVDNESQKYFFNLKQHKQQMETGYQPKESEKQNETNSEATPSASTKPEANNDKKPSAEAEENFVVVELQGRRRSSSYVDPVEACDFWKLHKESYIALRAWEDEKTAKAKNLKDLLNWLCDSLTLKMSKVNSSNQSLMSYFSLVATNIKELSKHCSKTTSPLDPIIAYHTFIGLPLAELFKKLKGANNNFFNSLKVFATFIEQKIVEELKEMTIKYAKTLAGLKELKPNLLLVHNNKLSQSRDWKERSASLKNTSINIVQQQVTRKLMYSKSETTMWISGSLNDKSCSQQDLLIFTCLFINSIRIKSTWTR
eukprot:TRINITY_DN857_c0_g1_i1.p3 TRINITY_DN857_c0_g1~~TRINITY_DN857_c0_g1_i1.p3  ORF type:complete len:613 (-),score=102.49 TRINITY_DN857_c0_g1_i1:22925-24763(-)